MSYHQLVINTLPIAISYIVLDSRNHTPRLPTVPRICHAARIRGVILGIDEMEWRREPPVMGIPKGVGPSCNPSEVVTSSIVQHALEENLRIVLHKVGRDVGDGFVAEAAPGTHARQRAQEEGWSEAEELHCCQGNGCTKCKGRGVKICSVEENSRFRGNQREDNARPYLLLASS